jgi:hypothetical protein
VKRGGTVLCMFTTSPLTSVFAGSDRDQALETWREAADLVRIRWQNFLEADSESRPWTFALYVAALDAEEAAAVELAALAPNDIAA